MDDPLRDAADAILERLRSEGAAELPGLGRLSLRVRPPRVGRDPITGARLDIPERRTLVFLAAPEAEEALRLAPMDPELEGDPRSGPADP